MFITQGFSFTSSAFHILLWNSFPIPSLGNIFLYCFDLLNSQLELPKNGGRGVSYKRVGPFGIPKKGAKSQDYQSRAFFWGSHLQKGLQSPVSWWTMRETDVLPRGVHTKVAEYWVWWEKLEELDSGPGLVSLSVLGNNLNTFLSAWERSRSQLEFKTAGNTMQLAWLHSSIGTVFQQGQEKKEEAEGPPVTL